MNVRKHLLRHNERRHIRSLTSGVPCSVPFFETNGSQTDRAKHGTVWPVEVWCKHAKYPAGLAVVQHLLDHRSESSIESKCSSRTELVVESISVYSFAHTHDRDLLIHTGSSSMRSPGHLRMYNQCGMSHRTDSKFGSVLTERYSDLPDGGCHLQNRRLRIWGKLYIN